MTSTYWLAAVSALALSSGSAFAQAPAPNVENADSADQAQPQPEEGAIGDIIVTAERRESSLQKTPLAISAFGEDFLEKSNVRDVQDIAQYAPGLSYNKVSNFVQLNIRGIGLEQINLGGEPGVALHIDGVYVARPFVGDAIFSDLARVEVLRGPQGTLYGRNATGGSVNLISNQPTHSLEGQVAFTYGNYDRKRGQFVVSGPLSAEGRLRGRFSAVADQRDGFLKNLVDGNRVDDSKTRSARASLAYDLSDNATLTVSSDYMRESDDGPAFQPGSIPGTAAAFGGRLDPSPRRFYADGPFDQKIRAWGTSARLEVDGDMIKFMSLTGYRNNKFRLQSDLDGTDFFLINQDLRETGKQFSQELQFSSAYESPLQWIAGLYYFQEDGTLNYAFPIPILKTTISFDATQKTHAMAAFGQTTYQITDKLNATAGLRYSVDNKKGSTIQNLFGVRSVRVRDSWSALTPRFVLEYQATPKTLVYGSVARGFKAGGLNTASLQADAYDPEFVWNYEVGLKTRFLDDRLQTNIAAFYYDYTDLQVNQFAVGQTFITNAASATGKGVEAEITAIPIDNLTINASLAYLDATFKDFVTRDSFRPALGDIDLSGNQLPRSPKFTSSIAAQYDIPLASGAEIGIRGEYSHRSKLYFTPFNTDYAHGGQFDLINARLSYSAPDDRWEAAIFGRNLTNETYEQTITVSGSTIVLYGPPRTYGAEVRYRF
jgi:iron complex outermembrane recepter protein